MRALYFILELFMCICMAPVAQTVENAIHQINLSPVNNAIGLPNTHIHRIVIYPVDSAIQLKNNWGLEI